MVVFAAQGDAERTMALLWRDRAPDEAAEPARSGPRPTLTVAAIVRAAIEVADAEGMAALSMRAVGERLGRTAMALYTYVPGKAELVDLMYDQAHAELPADYPLADGWRAALTGWAEHTWACYLRHPWVTQVSQARPVLGPHEFTMLEALVRVLRATGLPARTLRPTIGLLVDFVRGSARTVAEARQAMVATGQSDEEWWQARSDQLAKVAPGFAERFPNAVWINSDNEPPPADPDTPYLELAARQNFTAGLAVLADGIEAARARQR